MLGVIKKLFIILLVIIVNASNHTKCVSLSNQKSMTQFKSFNLHSNDHSQEFHYDPFAVKLDRCVGSCNTLNDLSNKLCTTMITGINESKTLVKHVSCKCKCKSDGRKCNSDQWWSNNKCWYECKNNHVCEKYYIWNPAPCSCEDTKYLANITDDSAITCD